MTLLRSLFAAAALAAASVSAFAQDLFVGYQLPLTGTQSQYGEVFRNAATLQLEKFNAAGGVGGRKVQIVYEDSKSDPKEAVNIARKFVDDKRIIAVLGDFASGPSMAAGEVYGKAGMPQLSQTASHPDFLKVSNWQFRNITTQAQEGPFNAKWLRDRGVKTVAVIGLQNDWGLSATGEFTKAFEALGGKVTSTELFNPGARDFKAILTKVSQGKPEAIYFAMFYEEGALILQQVRQLNVNARLYSASPFYAPKLIELAGPAAEGVLLSTTFVADSPLAGSQGLRRRIQATLRQRPQPVRRPGLRRGRHHARRPQAHGPRCHARPDPRCAGGHRELSGGDRQHHLRQGNPRAEQDAVQAADQGRQVRQRPVRPAHRWTQASGCSSSSTGCRSAWSMR